MRKIFAILLILLLLAAVCVSGVYGAEPGDSSETVSTSAESETTDSTTAVPVETEASEPETEAVTEAPVTESTEVPTEASPETPAATDPVSSGTMTIYCDDPQNAHWFTVERIAADGSRSTVLQAAILPGEGSVTIVGLPLNAEYRVTKHNELSSMRGGQSAESTVRFTDSLTSWDVNFRSGSGSADWLSDTASGLIRKGG